MRMAQLLHAARLVLFVILPVGCTRLGSAAPNWQALPAVSDSAALDTLAPVWDNRASTTPVDVRLYIEPYCRTGDCATYIQQTVPYFSALTNVHVRIYDYPLSQEAKSFLFSGIGRCIAQKSAAGYLDFLQRALTLTDAYDNNVQMQALSKAVIGEYDTRCINGQTKELQARFENANPLGWTRVPATVINGRVVYGSLVPADAAALVAGAQH